MITPRGIAIALSSTLGNDELAQLAERLMYGAMDLEMRADEELENGRRKILARRAEVLGDLAQAIEAEIEKTEVPR